MKPLEIFFTIGIFAAIVFIVISLRKDSEQAAEIKATKAEIQDIKKNVDIVAIIDSIERVRDRKYVDSLRQLKAEVDSIGRVMNITNTKLRKSNAALEKEVRRLDALLADRPDF
jgi:carbamoylphosphate synthase large subunit